MMKVATKEAFTLEIYEHDPNLRRAFSIAGKGRLTEKDLEAIGSHTFTLYLVTPGGSVDAARRMLHAAAGLLKAGGLAVKIESTGTAHRADQWAEFCVHDHLVNLQQAYVTYVGSKGLYYSCGMHNLGLSDALVDMGLHASEAAKLLHSFTRYLLIENPSLKDGETFSTDVDAPRYRLLHEPCKQYEEGDLFHNPFGVWKLTPT